MSELYGSACGDFIGQMMPHPSTALNLREAYQKGRDEEQNFIQNLALFLVTILKEHGSRLFEADAYKVSWQSFFVP